MGLYNHEHNLFTNDTTQKSFDWLYGMTQLYDIIFTAGTPANMCL